MLTLCRFLLVVCPALLGVAAGTWIGGRFFVPKGSGLAGGPMALGYGVLGAAVLAALGAAAAYVLDERAVRRGAGACLLVTLAVYGALGWRAFAEAEREPDSAFAPAGRYTAAMERLDTSDPFLFVKLEVDSSTRRWTQIGPPPKSQSCSAGLRAATLVDIRTALDAVVAGGPDLKARCAAARGPASKRLRWDLEGTKDSLDVTAACAQAVPEVGKALAWIEAASRNPTSAVRCR